MPIFGTKQKVEYTYFAGTSPFLGQVAVTYK